VKGLLEIFFVATLKELDSDVVHAAGHSVGG